MKRILVDTDVLIDFSKGHDTHLRTLLDAQRKGEAELSITPVNITEFMDNKELARPALRTKAVAFLAFFHVLEITKPMGVHAGDLLRQKHVTFLGDALIAAACVEGGYMLATRNRRHFDRAPGLTFYVE